MTEPDYDAIITAAARKLARAAFDVFIPDQHNWSERGCQTCSTITRLLDTPFGCDAYRITKAVERRHQELAQLAKDTKP